MAPHCRESMAGGTHEKLAASFVSPVPEYFGICGYEQSGRVMIGRRSGFSPTYFVAVTVPGAAPLSTQRTSEARRLRAGSSDDHSPEPPNASGPGPPEQCCTPGAMYRRTNESVASLPIRPLTAS